MSKLTLHPDSRGHPHEAALQAVLDKLEQDLTGKLRATAFAAPSRDRGQNWWVLLSIDGEEARGIARTYDNGAAHLTTEAGECLNEPDARDSPRND